MNGFPGLTGIFYQPQGSDSGDLDLEIEIPPLESVFTSPAEPRAALGSTPSFSDLFEDEPGNAARPADLKIKTFTRYDKIPEEPKAFFKDPDYYKKLLAGEGDISKRVHQTLQEFLKA